MSYPIYSRSNQRTYDPNENPDEIIGIDQQRKLAALLRNQSLQENQGQMVSGHYVAPSWTQGLAKVLQGVGASYIDNKADGQQREYNANKSKKFAEILSGNQPQQMPNGAPVTTQTMPAYEPNQMDSFGSPMPNVQRTPVETTTQPMLQETPQDVQGRQQAQIMEYVQKYGMTPEAQVMLSQLNKQDDRAYAKTEKLEDRTYNEGHEDKLYNRGRADKLSDVDAERKYQDIVRKDTQGFQVSQQDRQFAQQYKLQQQSQGFQAGENAKNRDFQASNQAPIAVMGADGQPVYVDKKNAIGAKPFTATTVAQDTKDTLKVQQQDQARLSAQQAIDQAGVLFNHPGRKSGTGASSFMSMIPATDAKGFKANLDTFKAQTFVPMVSALKGMGALSDAEGKKLAESVGALDPSMKEEEFANSLKRITNTLYEKAKASGLNVSLPDFAADSMADTASNARTQADKILGL